MAEAQDTTVECEFCLRKYGALPQPKILPYAHVHCIDCLTEYFDENNLVLGAVEDCGEVFDASPDTLPSYDTVGKDNTWCDVCVKKKKTKQEAVIYCTVCCKKFCRNHEELHDEVSDEHPRKTMQEYRAEATMSPTPTCTKHNDQPFILGCSTCLTVSCLKCIPEQNKCDRGTSHSLLPLDDLVSTLIQDNISAKMLAKEEKYEKLFKVTSEVRAEYDEKTRDMLELIHHTRDAQINELKLKYKKLEEELREKRQKLGVDMAEFIEDIVLKKWTQLRNQRQLMESRVKHSHKVDVVKGFKEMKEKLLISIEEELPKLQLNDEVTVRELGENRAIEVEVVSSDSIAIPAEQGQTTLQTLPHSLTLLKTVQLPYNPISVHHHNGSRFVGYWGNCTVSRIDNYKLYNSFITTPGYVESMAVYKDRLYTLSKGDPCVVGVYDMSGRFVTSWNHPNHSGACDMLTVLAGKVVVADPTNKRIIVYSLTGKSLRHIPCCLLGNSHIAVCAVGNVSVVVSNYNTSKVFRVHINTGEVIWTHSNVKRPQGLVRYRSYILLAAHNNDTIHALDISTGKIVAKIADTAVAGDGVFSLEGYGTTLVVLKYNYKQVLYYQIKDN